MDFEFEFWYVLGLLCLVLICSGLYIFDRHNEIKELGEKINELRKERDGAYKRIEHLEKQLDQKKP